MTDFIKASQAITDNKENIFKISAEKENKKTILSQELLDTIFPEGMGIVVYPKLVDGYPRFFGVFEDDEKGPVSELEIIDASKIWLIKNGFFLTLQLSNDRCSCSCNNMLPIVKTSEYEAILTLLNQVLFNKIEFFNIGNLNENELGQRVLHLSKDWQNALTESEKRELRNFLDKVGMD